MKAESNFNPSVRSPKGALGLMQLMPATAMGEYEKGGFSASPSKLNKHLIEQPELNINLGVRHIRTLEKLLSGIKDPDLRRQTVIVAYNAGLSRVARTFNCRSRNCLVFRINRYGNRCFQKSLKKLPMETRSYLIIVNAALETYRQLYTRNETVIARERQL